MFCVLSFKKKNQKTTNTIFYMYIKMQHKQQILAINNHE